MLPTFGITVSRFLARRINADGYSSVKTNNFWKTIPCRKGRKENRERLTLIYWNPRELSRKCSLQFRRIVDLRILHPLPRTPSEIKTSGVGNTEKKSSPQRVNERKVSLELSLRPFFSQHRQVTGTTSGQPFSSFPFFSSPSGAACPLFLNGCKHERRAYACTSSGAGDSYFGIAIVHPLRG